MAIQVTININGVEEFKSGLASFDLSMKRQVHEQIRKWATQVKESASSRAPVKTGLLRDSVYAKVGDWVAKVGADVSYAVFVEFGTRYMRARPFLFPAIQERLPCLESIICEAIQAAKGEAGL